MEYRLLGARTGLRVSALALGTGRLGVQPGQPDDPAAARAVFRAFAEAGGNFIDTSSAYQFGHAEELLGSFVAETRRDDFVIASKYGRTASAAPSPAAAGNHRKAMRTEVKASLRRLRTDHLDLYLVHFDDGLTPVDEIMRGFDELVRAGKIVYPGLSNFPAWRIASAAMLAELRGWSPLAVLQLQYNLLERDLDREHLPLARARGVGVMAYSPLASGRLSKPAADDATERDRAVFDTLATVATELGCERSSVALAWTIAHELIPVIGPRTVEQLAANLAAADVRLSAAQLRRLDEASVRPLGNPYELLDQARDASKLGSASFAQSGSVL